MSDALDTVALETAETATTDARPHRSRDTVVQNFTIQAMARSLAVVYSGVSDTVHDAHADSVVIR